MKPLPAIANHSPAVQDAHQGFDIITKVISAKSQKEFMIVIGPMAKLERCMRLTKWKSSIACVMCMIGKEHEWFCLHIHGHNMLTI